MQQNTQTQKRQDETALIKTNCWLVYMAGRFLGFCFVCFSCCLLCFVLSHITRSNCCCNYVPQTSNINIIVNVLIIQNVGPSLRTMGSITRGGEMTAKCILM